MPLKVFNTQKRTKEIFQSLNPPQVNMYVCGITAYDYCHLGHARASVVFDVIYRYLCHKGYQVKYVRNFTDIDDKIIKRSNETGIEWKVLAEKFISAFQEDMQALGNLSPTQEPRATEYIGAMQDIISQLIQKKMAYEVQGDVFYSVRSFPTYGVLAHKNIEELEVGARVEVHEAKHDPLDFALWKAAKPGEPHWPSPWGEGRPGWHIECSAMSTRLLGATLDIHGGGRDLSFPHHENERAQSEGATGKPFVRYWIHNGFVNLNADKMSKSTGNFLTIRDVLKKYPAEAVRYFLLSSHYRSPLDFSESNIKDALAAVERIYQTLERLVHYAPMGTPSAGPKDVERLDKEIKQFPGLLEAAMDDDFNTAQVLGYCFDLVREINKFLDMNPDPKLVLEKKNEILKKFNLVSECLGLFGQDPTMFLQSKKEAALQELSLSDQEILGKIAQRKEARAKKDFQMADKIREELFQAGILLKDNPDGTTTWTVK